MTDRDDGPRPARQLPQPREPPQRKSREPAPDSRTKGVIPAQSRPGGIGRACIGLGLCGQGLGILFGIVPHEDVVVGLGLLSFGTALVVTGRLPRYSWLRQSHLVLAAAVLLGLAGGAWAWTGEPPTGPKLILVALGVGALAAAAKKRGIDDSTGSFRAGDGVANAVVAVAAPMGVWLAQAGFKHLAGTTPFEVFMIAFLVFPVHWILEGLGHASQVQGQTLTLAGPSGPMPVEIGVACSGLQAMALFLMILGVFAALERPPGKRLAAWVAVGLAGVYVTNLVRLVVVLLVGHWWGGDALERVHADAGWMFFVAWTLIFSWWVRRGLPKATSQA